MSVEKARAALDALKELDVDTVDHNGVMPLPVMEQFNRLLAIARVQAEVAQAEALDRIADKLDDLRITGREIQHQLQMMNRSR